MGTSLLGLYSVAKG